MMKKAVRILGFILVGVVVLVLVALGIFYMKKSSASSENMALLGEEAPRIAHGGAEVRDLNKNGKVDVYEDPTASVNARVEDLIQQMTLEEKAGSMFINMIGMTPEGDPMETPFFSTNPMDMMMQFMLPSNSEMIARKKMNSFNILSSIDAEGLAHYNNAVQKLGERTRLGIPITIASDPRHGTENNPGAALYTPAFSQWPSSLGLAASRDTLMARQFGDMARQEYTAVGIRLALHPMADLATEPRWGRNNGTFGEDADLSAMMTRAYVLGFQGDSLGAQSVACMTKHFSGGGPQENGDDAHFPYGKNQVYPGNNFAYHVLPFIHGAFPARTAQIMPYYGIPIGQTDEDVAFGFNKMILTTLLRDSLGFDGVICTDWNIISDTPMGEGRAWGVEHLTPIERVKKSLDAGVDQFGGESIPELIIELVESGQISEQRIDNSVRRIMRDKFRLGLFNDPYVDKARASSIAGRADFRKAGKAAMKKSTILLKNDNLLPLEAGTKIYVEGWLAPETVNTYGELVDSPEDADVIVKRVMTPFGPPKSDHFLENFFKGGRLYFSDEELKPILELARTKPTVVVANLARPAILTEIDAEARAMMADFGTTDDVLVELLFGKTAPTAKLPFELPSSWEAVENQFEDVPYDSKDPLYPFGHGLTYD